MLVSDKCAFSIYPLSLQIVTEVSKFDLSSTRPSTMTPTCRRFKQLLVFLSQDDQRLGVDGGPK